MFVILLWGGGGDRIEGVGSLFGSCYISLEGDLESP